MKMSLRIPSPLAGAAITAAVIAAGCTGSSQVADSAADVPSDPTTQAPTSQSPDAAPAGTAEGVTYDDHGDPVGLHRYRKWSDRLGQGAQPGGEEAFRNLAALGYTTVLSVDGALPDLENARKHGLRYVHVPIGYDGVPAKAAIEIVKGVRDSEGPVYVHCHHGKHRGPAGAMIARIAVDGISNEQALSELAESQCSPKYKGLYRDVGRFAAPDTAAVDAAEIRETVLPDGVTEAMVHISHRWEGIKQIREASWGTPEKNPDIDPPHEATMLWEQFREMARLDESKEYGDAFERFLATSETAADALQKALRERDETGAQKAYDTIHNSCNACHTEFRN